MQAKEHARLGSGAAATEKTSGRLLVLQRTQLLEIQTLRRIQDLDPHDAVVLPKIQDEILADLTIYDLLRTVVQADIQEVSLLVVGDLNLESLQRP